MPYHISEGTFGGAEVQAWLLAKELARRGYIVTYICQSVLGKAGKVETIDGVHVYWLKHAKYFQIMGAVSLYKALKIVNSDYVVQRLSSFSTGVIGFYCRHNRNKFIWICTDDYQIKKWYFVREQLKVNKSTKKIWGKKIVFILNALINDLARHYGYKNITYAFTQNEFQRKEIKENFGHDSFKMISGHEKPDRFVSIENKMQNKTVLWVSNLGPRKRPALFMELARKAQGTDLKFIMIGERDDPEFKKKLFSNVPKNFEWLGKLPFEKTLEWFDASIFFINTSPYEGFPNTFVQAWMRGVPTISLEVDPDEVIIKNNLGIVTADLDLVVDYMTNLASDLNAYSSLSNQIKKYAFENHTINRMTDNFLSCVNESYSAKL